MNNRIKPSPTDWLKLVGMLAAIALAAIDIGVVRGRNKTLWNNLVLQRTEMEKQIKMIEIKSSDEIARANQRANEAEKRIAEAKSKVKDAEAELRNKTAEMREECQKQIDEIKASYETRIREMRDDFSRRLKDAKTMMQKPATENRQMTENVRKVACRRCVGKGAITVKKRCAHCGGSGKLSQNSYGTRRRTDGTTSTSVSTYSGDCPHCLPGAMKGGGSKGYIIERTQCPNCNGVGIVTE